MKPKPIFLKKNDNKIVSNRGKMYIKSHKINTIFFLLLNTQKRWKHLLKKEEKHFFLVLQEYTHA